MTITIPLWVIPALLSIIDTVSLLNAARKSDSEFYIAAFVIWLNILILIWTTYFTTLYFMR